MTYGGESYRKYRLNHKKLAFKDFLLDLRTYEELYF